MNKFDTGDMEVLYVKQIGGHPVKELVQKAVNEWAAKSSTASYELEAVYINDKEGRCIAAMTFSREVWRRGIDIQWTFVEPEYRRVGIHSKLFECVKRIAIRDGYVTVKRYVNAENHTMIRAVEAQGGIPAKIIFDHDLTRDLRFKFPLGSVEDKFSL